MFKISKRSRTKTSTTPIHPIWLLGAIVLIVIEIILIIMQNHDAILVIGLHLNFKMGFISDIENQCQEKGTPALILRNAEKPEFPFKDDCDRSDLGNEEVLIPDPQDSYKMDLEFNNSAIIDNSLILGGTYSPKECNPHPRSKVAVIIPHRHREYHLKQLLSVLHPTLQRQKIDYSIFVIHQAGEGVFNKARLLNAGVREALKIDKSFNCFIMHDVDLVMESEQNLYYCNPNLARHMSAGIDKYNYELPYDGLFGGVVALTKDQFEKINGYSNEYWGWGCEDDDMFIRVVHSCVGLEHVMHEDGYYKMIYHPHDKENSINSNRFYKLIHAMERQYTDGFNKIGNLYNVVKISKTSHFYTNITINVGKSQAELEAEQKLKDKLHLTDLNDPKAEDSGLVDEIQKASLNGVGEGASSAELTKNEEIEEDYAVDIQIIILVAFAIVFCLYKSRVVVYMIKKNKRHRRTAKYSNLEDNEEHRKRLEKERRRRRKERKDRENRDLQRDTERRLLNNTYSQINENNSAKNNSAKNLTASNNSQSNKTNPSRLKPTTKNKNTAENSNINRLKSLESTSKYSTSSRQISDSECTELLSDSDEKPLIFNKSKTHTRTQSMPNNDLRCKSFNL